jgi:glycine/D-amino acid oxidase-like deaminating enzyme
VPIYRPFINIEEQNEWQGKSADPTFNHFISEVITKSEPENIINDPFGGLLLKHSGYLDTNNFLDRIIKWLNESNSIIFEKFDIEKLNFIEKGVVYKDIKAEKVIFCDGVTGASSPYFTAVKYRPVKGEVLKIKVKSLISKVYNRGIFIIPRDGSCVVGSNYNHKELNWEPTESGKMEIESKLQALLKAPYELLDHKAGIRPSSADRRPVLGQSREKEQIVVFNGLGTKGVSLAPFYANQLVNWLCNGQPIDEEVNVNRFY